jgi:acetolactate decarboxylase
MSLSYTKAESTEQDPSWKVRWAGAQKNVMSGDLTAHITLKSLEDLPHLYAVGPLEELKGEITILDSQTSISKVAPTGVTVETGFEHSACFLAYAQVEAWREVLLPATVGTEKDLEHYLPEVAATVGIDPDRPLPFLLRGAIQRIELHILNKTDGLPHNPALHNMAKVHYTIEGGEAELIGFYSSSHQGVFTPGESVLHIHARVADGALSGHVEGVTLTDTTRLYLPQVLP